MPSQAHPCVVFYISPSENAFDIFRQQKEVDLFFEQHLELYPIKKFIESSYNHPSPILQEAVEYCLQHQSHMVLPLVKPLLHNRFFSKAISRLIQQQKLFCIDQPCINEKNFQTIIENTQPIKTSVKKRSARGNPHAKKLINKINQSKIKKAVLYSLLFEPIVTHYQHLGYSQRKLLKTLNQEGFFAPEGGHWVLSQLQKVLARIQFNHFSLSIEKKLRAYEEKGYTYTHIANLLNQEHVPSHPTFDWSAETVEKIMERLEMIKEITELPSVQNKENLQPILQHKDLYENTQYLKLVAKGSAFQQQLVKECKKLAYQFSDESTLTENEKSQKTFRKKP